MCTQAIAIYEVCRSVFGDLWNGSTDTYGRFALAAAPSHINATDDDDALMKYGVKSMCDVFGFIGTYAQVRSAHFLCPYSAALVAVW